MLIHRLIGLFLAFAALSLLFGALQRFWPQIRSQKVLRRGFRTDCIYWLWTPIVTRLVAPLAVAIALLPIAALYGTGLRQILQGYGPLAAQPLWLQGVEIFVLGDLLGYWQHRLFHATWLWPFHAVHHSSTELDWLSSVRLHPVNDVVSRLIVAVPLVALGFNTSVVALYAPFTTFYAILIHANLDWDYGPLRFAIASPAFHRWHHSSAGEGQNRNFSGGLPLWDIVFGTFHMPRGQAPRAFGVGDEVPESFSGQMLAPFRGGRP